jgi:hypothetical protein
MTWTNAQHVLTDFLYFKINALLLVLWVSSWMEISVALVIPLVRNASLHHRFALNAPKDFSGLGFFA